MSTVWGTEYEWRNIEPDEARLNHYQYDMVLWMNGEVNLSCIETAGLRQEKNGQNGVIEIWMLELFINLGMVDKNSSLVVTRWSETIKPSPGDVCDCLGLHQAILSQVRLEVLTFYDCESNSAPDRGEFHKRTFFIEKIYLMKFPTNRLIQFFWRAYPQAHSWQGIDTALDFSPILAGTLLRPSQYCFLTPDRWSSFLSPEKYWEGVKIFHAESRRLILSGLIFRLEKILNF